MIQEKNNIKNWGTFAVDEKIDHDGTGLEEVH